MSFGAHEYATNATDSGGPAEDPYQKYVEICKKQNEDIDDFILQELALKSKSPKNHMKLILTEIDEVSLDYSMSLD